MAFYEVTFILRPELSNQDVDRIAGEYAALAGQLKGKVIKKENWGLRSLAYRIKKSKKGHYVMLGLEASGAAVKELDRKLGINEDVLRSLIVKVESVSKNPSPILQSHRDEEQEAA